MASSAKTTQWVPLLEYAVKRGVSLSTLRRHIKSNKILHKVESGRYLIFDEGSGSYSDTTPKSFVELKVQLLKAQEEIAELKTLIAFYEEANPPPRLDV